MKPVEAEKTHVLFLYALIHYIITHLKTKIVISSLPNLECFCCSSFTISHWILLFYSYQAVNGDRAVNDKNATKNLLPGIRERINSSDEKSAGKI